ncbi:hypothetical protein J437_LFUL007427 [Ladona fulva]|uniref:Ubiquitin-associated protein 2 n=1 Tax=Ladona fulva TaxID=123851 RepID=A0A8K0NWH5_LADFU|nr:hypothetical protein J437_LFUL007427 [Ladona fulva]
MSASFSTSSFGGSAASYSNQIKVQTSVPPPASQSSVTQSMPARTKSQRPRVPPPSKIPSTAVEMPGDAINSSITFLDVQFGGLEFGSETSSFDFSSDQSKYSGAGAASIDSVSNSGTSSAIDLNASNSSKSQSTTLDGYSSSSTQQSSKDHNQSGMSMGQNQKLSGPENIQYPSNQNAEHKPSQPAFSQARVSGSGASGMDIGKSDAGLSYSASSTVTYQNSYQNQKPSASVYPPPSSYSTSSGYTSSQAQSSSTPYQSSQSQSSFPQSQSNSAYASQAANSSYPSSQASNSAPSYSSAQSVVSGSGGASSSGTGSGSYASSQPSVSSSSSYQTSGSQAVPTPPVSSSAAATSSAYQVAGSTASTPSAPSGPPSSFPSSMSQSASANSSYPSQSTYQSAGQSGYANSSSLGQSSGSSGGYTSSSAGQYQNSYGSASAATSQSHSTLHISGTGHGKIVSSVNSASKEPQFETTTTSSSNLSSTIPATTSSALSTNVNVSPALGLPTSSQTVNASNSSSTKVSSSTGKTGGLPNIPPGVPPIMGTHQYIMSQAGLPYFAGVQQPVFSYEDLQLLQQRIPHVQAGYYDLGYQAPTSLATGREGGLASVAYSVSDGRFARTDNNSSPVPSTLSQQNPSQAHQQPMLNPTALPPGYAYFYGGGMVPAGSFQYGTPAIYPMPTATNAHGATNNTQYPKPGSYGSAYGSGYDNLSQNQEYGKTGYVSGNQSQSKGGVGGNSGTAGSSASELGATMYSKSHVALGKVNSYDKQGFHSGTPPPFNMAGTQTTPMGAPSGTYPHHLFIPAMAPHQHHSTTLMHQPLHTMEMRNPGRRSESGSTSGQRSQSSNQPNKSGGKQGYSASYWANN